MTLWTSQTRDVLCTEASVEPEACVPDTSLDFDRPGMVSDGGMELQIELHLLSTMTKCRDTMEIHASCAFRDKHPIVREHETAFSLALILFRFSYSTLHCKAGELDAMVDPRLDLETDAIRFGIWRHLAAPRSQRHSFDQS